MTWIQDSIFLAIQLQTIFSDLEIPHYITGGVAAATYGDPRTTCDLDEDIILNKLRWPEQSQSEKQWRDILGILKVHNQTLDFNYLNQQAQALEFTNALVRSLTEAGLITN